MFSLKTTLFVLLALASETLTVAGASINPVQDIVLPSSTSAKAPLEWLGANGPWFAGPNVNGVSNDVPAGCTVEQAAYIVRHGSRYPDAGAYKQWQALQTKIQGANFKARGSLAFLPSWEPVLTNPAVQIAQESLTGYKESYDLGYTLRLRYPTFYDEGTHFLAWANIYPRVVQTARMFVRGYLGPNSDIFGQVITVNSTGSPLALGNSLSPGDLCTNYADGNGGTYATAWDAKYLPPIVKRLNSLLTGNLILNSSDVGIFPYLCGFESQITGSLSPWCSVFTDSELQDYEYRQDLRYYYGQGPGTGLQQTIMLPFLDSLVGLLSQGPGIKGTDAKGATFKLPNLLTAFVNDGQISSLGALIGVFDDQAPLSGTKRPSTNDWKYITSRFISMRGTVAFERLNCEVPIQSGYHQAAKMKNETFVRILLNDAVYPVPSCQSGPGKSCSLETYKGMIATKYMKAGNFHDICGVMDPAAPKVVKGAEFFTNLGLGWLGSAVP